MDLNTSPKASERFVDEIKRHYADVSGADTATIIAFQNLVYAFLIVIEKVGEDGDDAAPFIEMDEEMLADNYGFTTDDRIPIYEAGDDLLRAFREVLDEQRICPCLDDIDYVEYDVCDLFDDGPADQNYFDMATETSELAPEIIDAALSKAVAAVPATEEVTVATKTQPKPILKKPRSVTRRVKHRHKEPYHTRRVRFSH